MTMFYSALSNKLPLANVGDARGTRQQTQGKHTQHDSVWEGNAGGHATCA